MNFLLRHLPIPGKYASVVRFVARWAVKSLADGKLTADEMFRLARGVGRRLDIPMSVDIEELYQKHLGK